MTGLEIVGLAGGITIVILMILLVFSLCRAASDYDDWKDEKKMLSGGRISEPP